MPQPSDVFHGRYCLEAVFGLRRLCHAYEMLMRADAIQRLPDEIDASLRAVIAKMLARDVRDRYANVNHVSVTRILG